MKSIGRVVSISECNDRYILKVAFKSFTRLNGNIDIDDLVIVETTDECPCCGR